jgi:hypothetical protein
LDAAHGIAQLDEADPLSCWIRGVMHKIESDNGNSRYWYARAGRRFDAFADPKAELRAIRDLL